MGRAGNMRCILAASRGVMAVAYDERRISFIANEISEAIEQASFGRIPWAAAAGIF
jgi:hypothetical protein